jgi:hypothetical protein
VIFPVRIIKRKNFPDRTATADFGRDRIFFLGRDQTRVATGFFFWVATRGRSRPDIFFASRPDFFSGSRPVVGRDRIFFLGRDPWSVATHQKIPVATSTGSRSPTLQFLAWKSNDFFGEVTRRQAREIIKKNLQGFFFKIN